MKQKFTKIVFALAFLALSAGASAQTSGSCGTTLNWQLTGSGSNLTLTISGTGAMTNFSNYSSSPWYSQRNNIKTIVINNGATSIGNYAFYGCYNVTSVTIPYSVTSLGNYIFYNCDALASVTIPNMVTSIGNYAFYSCDKLESIIIPNSVTTIGEHVFTNCYKLTYAVIGNLVSTIGDYAFNDCQLLATVDFNATNCTKMGNASPSNVFSGCTSFTTLNIGNNVIKLPNYAFYNCSRLTSVIIPNSVTSIGYAAFQSCSGLITITIGSSVNSIGSNVFSSCSKLSSIDVVVSNQNYSSDNGVLFNKNKNTLIKCPAGKTGSCTIPISVTSIDNYAFEYCTGLTDINVSWQTPPNINSDVFYNVNTQSIKLHIPQGTKLTYQNAPVWKNFILVDGAGTGINNILESSINIYPNPVKDELKIESDLEIKKVEILDYSGKVIKNSINVSALPQGVYFVKIETDKGIVTKRIIKE